MVILRKTEVVDDALPLIGGKYKRISIGTNYGQISSALVKARNVIQRSKSRYNHDVLTTRAFWRQPSPLQPSLQSFDLR